MLLSAGVALPRQVWAHGYVQWEGTKMSKTAGTAVTLGEAIERHGPDALRYFLLREVGFEADGNFTWERFDERYTADLADGLGNLASRSLAMIAKYRDGRGAGARMTRRWTRRDARRCKLRPRHGRAGPPGRRGGGWELVATANLYIQQVAPWTLAKEGREAELDTRSRPWRARSTGWRCWRSRSSRAKREHLAVPGRRGEPASRVGHARLTTGRGLVVPTAGDAVSQASSRFRS